MIGLRLLVEQTDIRYITESKAALRATVALDFYSTRP